MPRNTVFLAGSLVGARDQQPEDQFSEGERLAIKLRIEQRRRCILIFHFFLALLGVLVILVNSIQTEVNHNRFWNYDDSLLSPASSRDKQTARIMAYFCSLLCVTMLVLNGVRFVLSLCLLKEIDHKVLLNAKTRKFFSALVIRTSQKVERLPDPQYYRHKEVTSVDTFHRARVRSEIFHFIAECLIIALHAPSYSLNSRFSLSQEGFEVEYGLDVVLSVLNLGKVYFLVTFLLSSQKWLSVVAIERCNLENFYPNYFFVLRCEIKEHPKFISSLAIVLSVVVFGYMVRAAEIPYMAVSGQDWLPLSNAGWYIIITMTTVGYGDFYPTTYVGRGIGVCVGVWGSFLISFFVVMVGTHLGLSHEERKVFERVKEEELLHSKFMVASKLVKIVVNHNSSIQRHHQCGYSSQVRRDVDRLAAQLHSIRMQISHFNEEISNQTSLQKFYSKLMFEIEELTKKSEMILNAAEALKSLQEANQRLDASIQNAEIGLRRMEHQLLFIQQNEFRFYKK